MMKIRIKFRKYGTMKFIGHLDVMRYFQKAIRRSEVNIRSCGQMDSSFPLGLISRLYVPAFRFV